MQSGLVSMQPLFDNTQTSLRRQLQFSRMNPNVIFLYYISLISISMMFNSPLILLSELLIVVSLAAFTSGMENTIKSVKAVILMMLFIIIINPLINHHGTQVLLSLNGFIITKEATLYGVLMALSLAIILLIFVSYNKIMSNDKFLFLFGRILPHLTLLSMIVMRFVPLFLQRFGEIKQIQKTRGIQVEDGSVKKRSLAIMKLIEILLVDSCYDAFQTADSMASRGFGTTKRSSYNRYRMKRLDWIVLVIIISGMLFLTYSAINHFGTFEIFSNMSNFSNNLIFQILTEIVVVGVCGIPILMEMWEELWWIFLK